MKEQIDYISKVEELKKELNEVIEFIKEKHKDMRLVDRVDGGYDLYIDNILYCSGHNKNQLLLTAMKLYKDNKKLNDSIADLGSLGYNEQKQYEKSNETIIFCF